MERKSPGGQEDLGGVVIPETLDPAELQNLERALWFSGDLFHILRPHGQRQLFDALERYATTHRDEPLPFVGNCHRRLGKSFGALTYAFGRCLRKPHQIARYGAPTFDMVMEITEPLLNQIMARCPPELRPRKSGHTYYFRNPAWHDPYAVSMLYLIGCKEGAEKHRGKGSDVVILDEAAFVDRLEEVVHGVFGPHFIGREEPVFGIFSTPPTTIDHYFVKLSEEAKREDRYVKIDVTENADFSPRDHKMLSSTCGGVHTTAWKREGLCRFVTDEARRIIPEFDLVKNEVIMPVAQPERFHPHVFADFGWIDDTAFLFGYWHFEIGRLVVEDEIVVRQKTTSELASLLRERELKLWHGNPIPPRRVADNTAQGIDDWRRDQRIFFSTPPDRHDPDMLSSMLRSAVAEKRIFIHPRCEKLIYQLENGVRNERGKFERTDKCGHCDAISALMYGWRLLSKSNPYPLQRRVNYDSLQIVSETPVVSQDPSPQVQRPPPIVRRIPGGVVQDHRKSSIQRRVRRGPWLGG